ncbi:MAG: hypothetical protein HRT90_09735, partial [Candidatus Margulisbacteria bacterium]|nr:hypothetical protein [Candidatus Margulisiibacteriota bacterium]
MGFLSKHWKQLCLVGVLLLCQILITLPRLDLPFIDGRLHWFYDNANFTRMAVHSNDDTIKSPLKIFGLASYGYHEDGTIHTLNHYPDHPVLPTTLFKMYTSIVGYHDWVPRTYTLFLSLMITIVLFQLIYTVSGRLWVSAGLTLLYILLPLNFMYQDVFKHEVMVTLCVLLTFYFMTAIPKGVVYRRMFLVSLFFLFHSGWGAYVPALFMVIYLFFKRKDPQFGTVVWWALGVSMTSIIINFSVMYMLGFTPETIQRITKDRMSKGLDVVTHMGWLKKQLGFFSMNFMTVNAVCMGIMALVLVAFIPVSFNYLTFLGWVMIVSASLWIGVFRNLSFIHHYSQWYFGLAYVGILGGIATSLKDKVTSKSFMKGFGVIICGLCIMTFIGANQLRSSFLGGYMGTAEDIEVIRNLNRRLVIFSNGASGQKVWWNSVSFSLYADPVYKSWKSGRALNETQGGRIFIDKLDMIDPNRDVVVILNRQDAFNYAIQKLKEKYDIKDLQLVDK